MNFPDVVSLKKIKAVLWDLDGTLIDSAPLHWRAWQQVLAEHSLPLSYQDFMQTFGLRNDDLIPMWLGADIASHEMEEIAIHKEDLFRQELRSDLLTLMPAVDDLLLLFRQIGWKQAIATMTPRENLEVVLNRLPIQGYFDLLLTGEAVPRGKPAPDIFLAGAAQLGILPDQCMVIEDSAMGVEAALRGDMLAIGVGPSVGDIDGSFTFPDFESLFDAFSTVLRLLPHRSVADL